MLKLINKWLLKITAAKIYYFTVIRLVQIRKLIIPGVPGKLTFRNSVVTQNLVQIKHTDAL